jgi:hypothetical protein
MYYDLDDLSVYSRLDPQGMGDEIDALPDQLQSAWRLGQQFELPTFSSPPQKGCSLPGWGDRQLAAS